MTEIDSKTILLQAGNMLEDLGVVMGQAIEYIDNADHLSTEEKVQRRIALLNVTHVTTGVLRNYYGTDAARRYERGMKG